MKGYCVNIYEIKIKIIAIRKIRKNNVLYYSTNDL